MTADPVSSVKPAGLFAAANATTAIPSVSLVADLNALASALALRFDVSRATYVMSSPNVRKIAQSATFAAGYAVSGRINGPRIVQSPDVPDTRIGLIADANVLRSLGFDLASPDGSIQTSRDATGHVSDTPSADMGGGTNPSPIRSAWQRQCVHVRMPVWAMWATRYVEGVQHVEDAAW